ncbi:MAG: glycosyltransferase family 1 protein [Anaerolineae bacterium]
MTYLVDGRYIQDHFPGIGRYVFNLIEAFARVAPDRRFRVLVNPGLRNTRFDLGLLSRRRNLELVPVSAPTFSPREQGLGLNRSLTANASLWHSAYYIMPYLLPVPAVVTLEDVTPLVVVEEMPGAAKRILYRLLNRIAAWRARSIITLSHAAERDIVQLLGVPPHKLTVVPLAADERFRPCSAKEIAETRSAWGLDQYVLYLGSNKPHKNLVRLVQAWAQVSTDIPLVIAGHWDPRYPDPMQMAARLNISHRVRFIHDLANAQLPALLGGAQLFVFPSVHEGFGLPPLEAMACGAPVACANASSLPEVVGEAAALFNPLDVEGMAGVLTRVLEDSTLRTELSARSLVQAGRFSWDRTARETLAVYHKIQSIDHAHSASL